jgi:hypothetical protein
MAWYVLLHLCYAVRPVSDHVEVSHNLRLSYTNRLSHTQGVCRDGEEPLDRLLPVFYEFRTGCFRDSQFGLLWVASWYDLPPFSPKQTSEANPNSKAMVAPNLPFDEYRICAFQLWKNKEVIHVVLSLVYGTFFLLFHRPSPTSNPFLVKDALALLIIVYSAKRHNGGLARVGGVPSLLDKIRQDATIYFLVLSTGHLLFLFFEIFAPVSDHPVDLRSAAHDKPHIGFD